MLIARLIADNLVDSASLENLTETLSTNGASIEARHLPATGVWELATDQISPEALRAAIDAHCGPSDCLITPTPPRLPKLLISDMDSTMIGQECIDELADFAGIKERVADITERAMRGELDFAQALTERVGLLAGLPAQAIADCLAQRIRPMQGARTLVQTLKAKGTRTVLVTGGFHQFADPVAQMLGFDRVVANRLAVEDGALTGELDGPICDSNTKKATLLEEMATLGDNAQAPIHALATGDGANDIPMIEAAAYGIAFAAKPKARAAANGWIDRGDLTAILRLLGVPESEWVK